ncbi:MAG: Phosphoglucomutase [Candidatus Dichloromethanomonas elyunquensis]|nr:MAG: Phosphoglucomutase [Candidatus Dichloromethanomonas elyunquensis]
MSQVSIYEKYKAWTKSSYFDQETREELLDLHDQKELEDRFYTDLEFGTGGMRGILGAGTNRMNKYVIRKVTQGLADTIKEQGAEACHRGVVIAFDSRRYSAEFAMETALVLAANGIKAYVFDSLRPTPELSFAVRFLHTIAGVNITASHNPKNYNGYKVYWEDGGQIPPHKAKMIVEKISRQRGWEITVLSEEEAEKQGLVLRVGEEIDKAYFLEIKKQLLFPELAKEHGKNLKIVYTPLHGTGGRPVQKVLEETGFTSFFIVPEQEKPDGEFSTVESPNPEDSRAFQLALDYAERQCADIVLATDPDADRLGLYAKQENGEYRRFTGNEIGILLEYYLLTQKKKMGQLQADAIIIKTIASTDLGEKIADQFGVKMVNVLVGFKYIGEQIKDMEEKGWGTYLFGFEESFGYLAGTYARDKDAVEASALLSEAALHYLLKEGKTLPAVLEEIFLLCGYYKEDQTAISLQGKAGKERIDRIMDYLRTLKPNCIGEQTVGSIEDYLVSRRFILNENREEPIDLPQENVIRFSFRGGGFVMARPSGTEPKVRFYFCIRGDSGSDLDDRMARVKKDFLGSIQELIKM